MIHVNTKCIIICQQTIVILCMGIGQSIFPQKDVISVEGHAIILYSSIINSKGKSSCEQSCIHPLCCFITRLMSNLHDCEHHEKTCFLHKCKNKKCRSAQRCRLAARNYASDQHPCICYIHVHVDSKSLRHVLPKSKMSSLWPSSVVVQPCLCRAWWDIPKTGFQMMRVP